MIFLHFLILFKGIPLENLLNCTLSQEYLIFLNQVRHLFVLFCRLVSDILRIIFRIQFERRFKLSILKLLPRKVLQPTMITKLLSPSPTQTHYWSSLNEFVNEISSLYRPPLRDLAFLYCCLLG